MLYTILLLGLVHALCGASYFDCPKGWVRNDRECWLASTQQKSWVQSYEFCTAQTPNGAFADIENEEENNAVKNLVKESNFEYWFGLETTKKQSKYRYSTRSYSYTYSLWWNTTNSTFQGYNNAKDVMAFSSRYHTEQCGFIDDNGYWYLTSSCHLQKRFVCQKETDCLRGYYGPNCQQKCNCYKADCNRTTGVCPHGCSHGWTGDECKIEKQPAQVAVYCMKESNDEQYALLRVDLKGMEYDEIYILDDNESIVCNKSVFTQDENGIYNLKIDMQSNDADTQCSPKSISQGTFQWTLRTEEVEGLLSEYDRKFHVDCNFSNAEKMSRAKQQSLSEESKAHLTSTEVKQTKESVQLMIQDPSTKTVVSQIKLGDKIQLAMVLITQNTSISAKGISPFNCTCSTSDGKITHALTDSNGCPLKNSPIYSIEDDSSPSHIYSNSFDAFTIEGRSDILFQCQFQFCFDDSRNKECPNRCQYSRLRRFTKRSVDRQHEVFSTASIFVQSD